MTKTAVNAAIRFRAARALALALAGALASPGTGMAGTFVDHGIPMQLPAAIPPALTQGRAEAPLRSQENERLTSPFVHLGTEEPSYAIVVSLTEKRVTVFDRSPSHAQEEIASFPFARAARSLTRAEGETAYYPVAVERGRVRAWSVSDPEILASRRFPSRRRQARRRDPAQGARLRRPETLFASRGGRGLLALAPEHLRSLSTFLVPLRTPVVILAQTRKSQESDALGSASAAGDATATVAATLDSLTAWRLDWEKSRVREYGSRYDLAFSSLGRSREKWIARMGALDARENGTRQVKVSTPHLLRINGKLLAIFSQEYTSDARSDFGLKVLSLREDGTAAPLIASEHWQPVARSRPQRIARRDETPARRPSKQ